MEDFTSKNNETLYNRINDILDYKNNIFKGSDELITKYQNSVYETNDYRVIFAKELYAIKIFNRSYKGIYKSMLVKLISMLENSISADELNIEFISLCFLCADTICNYDVSIVSPVLKLNKKEVIDKLRIINSEDGKHER